MPERRSEAPAGLARSVLLGGGAAGLLSIFPVLNLLNLFFMLWIVLGAGLTVRLLTRANPRLRRGDALLAGALSGLVAGGMFALLGLVSLAGMTEEAFERALAAARAAAPFLADGQAAAFEAGPFKAVLALALAVFLLLAIVAGGLGGLAARRLLRPAPPEGQ